MWVRLLFICLWAFVGNFCASLMERRNLRMTWARPMASRTATQKFGRGRCLYVYVFHPFLLPSSLFRLLTRNLYFIQGWQTTKTRYGSVPFANSVEAEAITTQLLRPAPGQHSLRKGHAWNWSHNALSPQRPLPASLSPLRQPNSWAYPGPISASSVEHSQKGLRTLTMSHPCN